MKNSLLLIFIILLFPVSAFSTGDNFSEGYRLGRLIKYSEKGYMTKSGEGQLMMGREGTEWIIHSGDSKTIKNPWAFSSELNKSNEINSFIGRYTVIHYEEVQINNRISFDTPYRVLDIQKVNKSAKFDNLFEVPCPGNKKSQGIRVGRIVKASKKGRFVDSWEITVQVGNSGGTFVEMSVTDPAMYEHAIKVLRSSKIVNVHYVDIGLANKLSFNNTPYRVWRIELIDDDI